MRYIQAAVSDENHKLFRNFAFHNELTLSDLIETAVVNYIKRKEEDCKVSKDVQEEF